MAINKQRMKNVMEVLQFVRNGRVLGRQMRKRMITSTPLIVGGSHESVYYVRGRNITKFEKRCFRGFKETAKYKERGEMKLKIYMFYL